MANPTGAVVIDPGHGGTAAAGKSTPGGVTGPSGVAEKDVVLDLARRVAVHLGGDAILTRMGDANLPLAERSAVARRYGAKVFVSLHASGGAGGRGAEAWVHPRTAAGSRELAECLTRELAAFGGGAGPVAAGELAVLAPDRLGPGVAGCLLEVDRLADAAGERRFRDPVAMEKLGGAIARGIRRYMGRREATARRREVAEGQLAPAVVVGIVGVGIATFSLVNALEQRAAGGLTWSRNISKAIHAYPEGTAPNAWEDREIMILDVDCISGLSSAWALFTVKFRCNGNDLDQCAVEKSASSDWTISKLTVAFEGNDAQSYEKDSVGCIAMYVTGTLDPAGTGDVDFSARGLVKADGTFVNQEFRFTRGDSTDFSTGARDDGFGWFIRKA